MSSSRPGKGSDRAAEAPVHDVSDLSELDDFTEEMERALAEAGGSSKGVEGGQPSVVVPVGKSKRGWGRFFGRGS